jgi:Zn-dependent M28 family amino/carboxypeptidase
MIGRIDKYHVDSPEYVYLIGSDKISLELHNISEKNNDEFTGLLLDYKYNADDDPERYYYRSDHYKFAENGIPVIFYFTGAHEDYHKPTDVIEKIEFVRMKRIIELIFYTSWNVANMERNLSKE